MDFIKPIGQEPAGAQQAQQTQQAPPPQAAPQAPPEAKQNLQTAIQNVDTAQLSPQAMSAMENIQG